MRSYKYHSAAGLSVTFSPVAALALPNEAVERNFFNIRVFPSSYWPGQSCATASSGITKDFTQHSSGMERQYYGPRPGGEPNGFLVDAGVGKTQDHLHAPTKEQVFEAGNASLQYNHRLGITSWLDPLYDESVMETHQQLSKKTVSLKGCSRTNREQIENKLRKNTREIGRSSTCT